MLFQACPREKITRRILNRTDHIHETRNMEMGSKRSNIRQKHDLIKKIQQHLKKAELPPVEVNIRLWRLGPLGPREAGGNKRKSQNGIKER